MPPLRIGLIGYDGVQGLDIVGPSDAFTIATIQGDSGTPERAYEVIIIVGSPGTELEFAL